VSEGGHKYESQQRFLPGAYLFLPDEAEATDCDDAEVIWFDLIIKFYDCDGAISQMFHCKDAAVQMCKILTHQLCHLTDLNAANHLTFRLAFGLNRENI